MIGQKPRVGSWVYDKRNHCFSKIKSIHSNRHGKYANFKQWWHGSQYLDELVVIWPGLRCGKKVDL